MPVIGTEMAILGPSKTPASTREQFTNNAAHFLLEFGSPAVVLTQLQWAQLSGWAEGLNER